MVDETTGEMPTTPAGETPAEPQPETPAVTVESLQAELEKVQKALKDANKEAASRRKLLEQYDAEKKQREEAELSETDKLKKQVDEMKAELAQRKLSDIKRAVADKVGLPAKFADRIQGDTEEAMEADAKELLEAMPKAGKPAAPNTGPTNPGGGAAKETEAEKRKRLFG